MLRIKSLYVCDFGFKFAKLKIVIILEMCCICIAYEMHISQDQGQIR